MIRLENFKVERNRFGEKKGFYECRASFSSEDMNFTINLPQELGEELVKICKKHIGQASERALEKLTMMAREEDKEVKGE